MTSLDDAHAQMEANSQIDAYRLQFFECLAETEMFLLLEEEPDADVAKPMLFPVEDQEFALVFDTEERLSEFAQSTAPFVSLSGRLIAGMLAGKKIGLGVNLSVAPSSMLLPASAVSWLSDTLAHSATETQAKPQSVAAPKGVPETLITSLDRKLAAMAGVAQMAYLAEFTYADQTKIHVVAFIDALEAAQPAITNAVSEVLTFSGIEVGSLDVLFLRANDPICATLSKVALRFDLPELHQPKARVIEAPGSNPDKPPKLR
ncbi:MAG: hypothetical protein COB84_06430 [Rhodobacteraceae bacterium]|nr:MAG: hypothetical protein COB84_06430 [Paracoccaceae bacterium]